MVYNVFKKMATVFESSGQVRILPSTEHRGTVIFMHGLGQSSVMWAHIIVQGFAPRIPHVQWILPQATEKPLTMNQGQLLPSWFDVASLPPILSDYDEAGITESVSIIDHLILEQVFAGLDPRNIVIAGFDQGATVSMIAAFTTLHDLGGVASLSGWIPPRSRAHMMYMEQSLSVFWAHGDLDELIPLPSAEADIYFLRYRFRIDPSSTRLQFKRYADLGHAVNGRGLEDLFHWLSSVLV